MKKKRKVHSFARRLTRWIILTQLIVMGLASYLIYSISKAFVSSEETSQYESYLDATNRDVQSILSDVQVCTVNRMSEIEGSLSQPDKLANIMEEIVAQNPRIHSCGISFIANYFPKKGRWYCPFAVRRDSATVERQIIGDAKHDYLKAEWFTEALKADSGYWSKPFFDGNDSIPLVSYLQPIRNKQGTTVAVLGADLSLQRISDLIQRTSKSTLDSLSVIENDSLPFEERRKMQKDRLHHVNWRLIHYLFIIDEDGTFIAHPDSARVINDNYFVLAKETTDTIDDYIGRQMVAGQKGSYLDKDGDPASFDYFDMKPVDAYMFYRPVEHTNWSIAIAVPSIMIDGLAIGSGVIMLILIGLALLVGHIVGRITIRRATKPLNQLADSADEVAKGNFNAPLPMIKHNDEVRQLRDSFEGMQHSLKEYVEELKDTTASKAAIENELKVAHDIQMSMLPKTFPPYPERNDIDIYGMLTPAKDVGGDLFDFYIRENQLFFCIGDVSGKGVPASLVMAVTRSLFRNVSAHTTEPNQIVSSLNEALAEGNDNNMFVTVFVGVLDLATGHLSYCNAGHESPMLVGNEVTMLPCDSNLPVGVMAGMTFSKQETSMDSHTTIFLYTDGLNEAEDFLHSQFGFDRMTALAASLLAEGKNSPTTIVKKMAEAVQVFVGGAEQSDDLTMLAIKYTNEEDGQRDSD
jgi:sigma-B regulation protein RsbU (phosphoserine phosphatase)